MSKELEPSFAMTLLREHNLNRLTFLVALLLFAGGGWATAEADSILSLIHI